MSWRNEILTAFRSRVSTVTGFSSWIMVYTNRQNDTDPSASSQFIEESMAASSSSDTAIGHVVRYREIVGTYQLMLCVPLDSDVIPALAFADAIELAFLAQPMLTMADGVTPIRVSVVLIGDPRPARKDDPFVRIPVVLTYTVNTHT